MAKRKRKNPKVYDKTEDTHDIEIEGYDPTDIDSYRALGFRDGEGMEIVTREGDFILFEDSDEAGKAAREYWADMAAKDPAEFTEMVGADTLVSWGLGQTAGPGTVQVSSLNEWLDLYLTRPEEHFAGYDGEELEVLQVADTVVEPLGFIPSVAYRTN